MADWTDSAVRWRVPVGYPVALLCFWLARPTPRTLAAGAAIALLGLILRGLAAGHLRKNSQLTMSGPYARVRNPLYLGSMLLAIGFGVAARSWIAAAVLLAYFGFFYTLTVRREERWLAARYGAAFAEYAARVPAFLPRLRSAQSAGQSFSWSLYRSNREYRAALGMALAMVLLWIVMRWRG
jgi:protein-S-isoprenylcysteine O-methyltransferase Ste14